MILLSDRLFVGVGIFFFFGLQRSIDMGLDSPEHLSFFPEILEGYIVNIVLLFQFCIPGLNGFAVVLSIGAILGQQPVGSIEQIQFCLMFSLVL